MCVGWVSVCAGGGSVCRMVGQCVQGGESACSGWWVSVRRLVCVEWVSLCVGWFVEWVSVCVEWVSVRVGCVSVCVGCVSVCVGCVTVCRVQCQWV